MSKPRVIVARRWHPAVEKVLVEKFDTQLNGECCFASTFGKRDGRNAGSYGYVGDRKCRSFFAGNTPRDKLV